MFYIEGIIKTANTNVTTVVSIHLNTDYHNTAYVINKDNEASFFTDNLTLARKRLCDIKSNRYYSFIHVNSLKIKYRRKERFAVLLYSAK